MITRTLQKTIEKRMFQGKAIILVGARQVGKSTLMRKIVAKREENHITLECDDPQTRQLLTDSNTEELRAIIGNNQIVVIDEAQLVPNIGQTMKLIVDQMPHVQLLVSGSSAFELHNRLNEPLTGRKFEYRLYPITTEEQLASQGVLTVRQTLDFRLIYGSYPDVMTHREDAKELLTELVSSYLYKDLLMLDNIRKPVLINKLLVALALQVGSEVSYNEIAQTIGTDSKTVEKYIDLLEKCYVVFRLNALSRNVRNELKKSKKIYFYDNGVRNALLQNYAPLEMRQDVGALWENFFVSERIKFNHYHRHLVNYYFWRTTNQQEIDLIEESDGMFTAFEMKWNPKRANLALPTTFTNNYHTASAAIITPLNYMEWLS